MPVLYKKMSLEELIVLSQKEDFKALEELIKRIQKDVYATVTYMMKNNDHIMDLTQEILLKVAKNINSLKNPACFKGWLNHIISNAFYDEKRREKRKPETIPIDFTCPNINLGIQIELKDNKPAEKCITSECERQIKTAIRGLPDSFRLAIILREFQGLSYEQIANTTNSSIGTVKSRISRARIKLQEVLKSYL